nr:hypothetical protein [Micromonospora sp. DSM 115978]
MTAPIRIILDSTTIAAFAGTSVAVGEVIAEVGDENARVGVPVYCLAEAYRQLPEDELPAVSLLAAHPSTVIVDVGPADWLALAGLARDSGRIDTAAALLLAVDSGGYVLTGEPEAYGDWKDLPIIPI